MSFMGSIKTCFGKYVTFSGRASRSEFWWFILFVVLVSGALQAWMFKSLAQGAMTAMSADGTIDAAALANFSFPFVQGMLLLGFMLVTILPNLSVAVRRLHDTDRSGWWYWIALVPFIGFIILLVFFVSKGTQGENNFGADPLG